MMSPGPLVLRRRFFGRDPQRSLEVKERATPSTNLFHLRLLLVFLLLAVGPRAVLCQKPTPTPTPTPAPQRIGKSYSSEPPARKPPPPAPQAQSPVTFSDITSWAGIDFKRAPSFTSLKYLLEAMGGG